MRYIYLYDLLTIHRMERHFKRWAWHQKNLNHLRKEMIYRFIVYRIIRPLLILGGLFIGWCLASYFN